MPEPEPEPLVRAEARRKAGLAPVDVPNYAPMIGLIVALSTY